MTSKKIFKATNEQIQQFILKSTLNAFETLVFACKSLDINYF